MHVQDDGDPTVPLLERLRLLDIFSSNQDEFYRVRLATLHRLTQLGKRRWRSSGGSLASNPRDPDSILAQQDESQEIYGSVVAELSRECI